MLGRKHGAEGYLDGAQRYHFFAGWMPWLADGMGLIFTLLGLAWTVGLIVAPRYLEFPFQVFVVPTAGMFIFRMAHSLTLYRARVPCSVATGSASCRVRGCQYGEISGGAVWLKKKKNR